MKLRALSLVAVLAAACGGKSSSPTTGNTGGGGGGGVPPLWAEVMVEGATFTLDNQLDAAAAEMDPAEGITVVARVEKVVTEGDATIATIAWTENGAPLALSLPRHVKVSPAGVWFSGDGTFAAAPTYPIDAPDGDTGLYVSRSGPDGSVCYGEGPEPGAGDCEDVCFAELCVRAGAGITGGAGTWWPNYEMFHQSE